MGIGSITSTNSLSVMQMSTADLKDQKSKNIQNEITDVQQQMQKLSSKEDLSVNEKANERKKLQKEISGLNTELKQHQEELLRSQKRERMLAELREVKEPTTEDEQKNLSSDEKQPAQPGTVVTRNSDGVVILKEAVEQDKNHNVDTEDKQADKDNEEAVDEQETKIIDSDTVTDFRPSDKEIHAMVSADSSLQQASRLGTIIAKTSDGIAILKEEISQAKNQGIDTERKQAELEKMERQERLAMAFQSSILGAANNAMKSAAEANVSSNDSTQAVTETNAYFNALSLSQEEQISQQKFFVSFG
ncbi:MAG: hypothetical protein K2L82_12025 [Lachnospiraceae bacterium]|nr:hypothetical protein [Lachnospiraceae bacterium]